MWPMSTRHTLAIFPGTFDPLTNGHLDIIRRGTSIFDELIVAIGSNPEKSPLFTADQRVAMIRDVVAEQNIDVRVEQYQGLTVDYAQQTGATAILRGIRNYTDLQFEFQLALTNRAVADVETVFIMAGEHWGFTSSTLIRQIAASGRIDHLEHLLPTQVITALRERLAQDEQAISRLINDAHTE